MPRILAVVLLRGPGERPGLRWVFREVVGSRTFRENPTFRAARAGPAAGLQAAFLWRRGCPDPSSLHVMSRPAGGSSSLRPRRARLPDPPRSSQGPANWCGGLTVQGGPRFPPTRTQPALPLPLRPFPRPEIPERRLSPRTPTKSLQPGPLSHLTHLLSCPRSDGARSFVDRGRASGGTRGRPPELAQPRGSRGSAPETPSRHRRELACSAWRGHASAPVLPARPLSPDRARGPRADQSPVPGPAFPAGVPRGDRRTIDS